MAEEALPSISLVPECEFYLIILLCIFVIPF